MAASCAGIFFFGIVLALLGTVLGLPGTRERLGISMAQQGDLFFLLYLGVFLSTLISGPTIDRFGNRPVLILAALGVTAALAGFASAHSFGTAAVAGFVLGLGGGGLNTSTNALVSDLYGENRGPMLNILGVFFGFGALCMPFVAASLSKIFTVGQLLCAAAVPAAIACAAFALLPFPAAREGHKFSFSEVLRVSRDPDVWLMAVLLLFASGNEAAIGGWTSTFLAQQGADGRTATWVLAGFWGSLMLGRLLAARLLRRISKARLVIFSGIGSAVGCGLLVGIPTLVGGATGVIIAGLSFAPVFPTTLAIAGDRYARFAGSVFSVLFAVALLGGMSFPWAIGHLARTAGVGVGLLLPVFGALVIVGLATLIERRSAVAAKS